MKYFYILLVINCNSLFSQSFTSQSVWSDDFSTSRNFWKVSTEEKYSVDVLDEELVCELYDRDWVWTYIGIPKALSNAFNESDDEIALNMDYKYSIGDNGEQFGFIFDLHNVDDNECPGGDGYSLIFNIDHAKKTLTPAFFSTKNCNDKTLNYVNGSSIQIKATNKISIRKLGATWQIYINGQVAMNLSINGFISIDKLKFGIGKYRFDNLGISKSTLLVPKLMPTEKAFPPKPTIYAICVGIDDYSQYEGNGIDRLTSAVSDANKYYSFLQTLNGGSVPKKQIVPLTDLNATRNNILATISQHFKKAGKDDLVVLFISGHGGPNSFFCASDGPLKYSDLNKVIESSTVAGRKLLLADACFSGNFAAAKSTFGAAGKKYKPEEALDIFYGELKKSNTNITYLLAAQPDELSWENLKDEDGKAINGGTFTYYLVKGLSCAAKNPNIESPSIYVRDIYKYLNDKVSNAHINQFYFDKDGHRKPVTQQHPVINGQANLDMPVGLCNK